MARIALGDLGGPLRSRSKDVYTSSNNATRQEHRVLRGALPDRERPLSKLVWGSAR